MAEANPRGTFRRVAEVVRATAPGKGGLVRESDIVRERQVSRTTARRALKVLEADGFLRPEPGVGWRVMGGEASPSLSELMTVLIHDEHLAVGDAFPSESTLCDRFQKSRPTIRRALAVLEADGVLLSLPGKGRTVLRVPNTIATSEAGVDEPH
ncbi:GntR family transcriptional regulator [Streptomyces sp. ICBB 8177]|uniref:GntR family transcriptional regulator n=1 Tax=Streptomyces sp. ICBB 8177 TaxID=563922 RepID=UPI000D679A24|nr:GntR family transcriptional regulator [Streptomyces sp. ICBB 8177]PWI43198.1 GntR family transcriptional regulator [Streptomyces sp. ICBB 8177]